MIFISAVIYAFLSYKLITKNSLKASIFILVMSTLIFVNNVIHYNGLDPTDIITTFEFAVVFVFSIHGVRGALKIHNNNKMKQTEQNSTRNYTDTTPHPWRRHFARYFDCHLVLILLLLIMYNFIDLNKVIYNYIHISGTREIFFDYIFLFVFSVGISTPLIAISIGITGSTPGKMLYGIKVLGPDKRPIGFVNALCRELTIIVKGVFFYIPLISSLYSLASYFELKKRGHCPWDTKYVIAQRPGSPSETLRNMIGFLIHTAMLLFLNYNYYQ